MSSAELINIYNIIGRNMVQVVFELPSIIDSIKHDIEKGYARNIHWGVIKNQNIWFAALIDECNDFRKDNYKKLEKYIKTGYSYDIYFLKGEPRLIQYSHLTLNAVIENNNPTLAQVPGSIIYWFSKKDGSLRKVEVYENISGESWELWPNFEDFTADHIRISRDSSP